MVKRTTIPPIKRVPFKKKEAWYSYIDKRVAAGFLLCFLIFMVMVGLSSVSNQSDNTVEERSVELQQTQISHTPSQNNAQENVSELLASEISSLVTLALIMGVVIGIIAAIGKLFGVRM